MGIIQKYQNILRQGEIKVNAGVWIFVSLIIASGVTAGIYFAIDLMAIPVSPLIAVVVFIVLIDLFLGYPSIKARKRIDDIERNLPDALKQMADTLKAGGTYEYALREISTSQYGYLTKEMNHVLRKLEEGENLENSLRSFSDNVDSRLIKRSVAVIVDSIKAGAGLAEILDEIADDIRAMHRIGMERKSRTLMQVLFMVSAGAFVAPFIMGMVSTIVAFLIVSASAGLGLSEAERALSMATKDLIVTLMQIYIIIEVVASGAMIALMRDGKISKSIIYIPLLLLIAFIVFYASKFMTELFLGGAGAVL